MHVSTIEQSLPAGIPGDLPLILEQRPSRSSIALKALLIVPGALALFYPFVLIAIHAATEPASRLALASPGAITALLLAVAFWAVLFAWPLRRLVSSVALARTVVITPTSVMVTEGNIFGSDVWQEKLANYTGIAHHVRTSLSGQRHELILAHPGRGRSVLLAMAPRITVADVDQVKSLLGLVEIPSRDLYRMPRLSRPSAAPNPAAALEAQPI